MGVLGRRMAIVGSLFALVVGSVLALPTFAEATRDEVPPVEIVDPHADHGLEVAGQNALDHGAHRSAMVSAARATGLQVARGDGLCGDWFQFETARGLKCSKGPMLESMFTEEQLAAATDPPAYAADPKVTCIGNGSEGMRFELIYARRSNRPDRYAATSLQMKGWAAGIEQTFVLSAQKTGGVRKARWTHDANCVAVVRNVVVGNSVTSFQQLVGALEAAGYDQTNRKFLVAWDDTDASGSFCGLGQSIPDSTPGPSNINETQQYGAMFAAMEPVCWTTSVAAHELMHTLGAVQGDAPNATPYGHCTDESDIMCYSDGPGSVMRQVCPSSQEQLLDCNNDDYFHTNPPVGNYLRTKWNPASSGYLDQTGTIGPPSAPGSASIAPGGGSVTVTWTAPLYDGGSPVRAYIVALSNGRSVTVATPATSTTITGLADGTAVSAFVSAANARGAGAETAAGSAVPSPPVQSIATRVADEPFSDIVRGPDGSVYAAEAERIVRIQPNGTTTTVVGGGAYDWPLPENTLALQTAVQPYALATAPNGDLFFADGVSGKVRRLTGGRVNSVAGNGDYGTAGDGGSALSAQLQVSALAVGPDSTTVFVVDRWASTVRRFTVGGTISRVAGTTATYGFQGDGGPATSARFSYPSDIAVDASGAVFVADTTNHRIRRFTVGGTIATVAGDGSTGIWPGSPLTATATGVSYPESIDWSPERGLTIETYGLIRVLSGTQLVRVAGDLFTAGATDADGTPAGAIDFTLSDSLQAIAWSGSYLHVLAQGFDPIASQSRSRVRTAGPWSAGSAATAPAAPVIAPTATAGQQAATVRWIAPSNGGSPITGYQITRSPGGQVTQAGASATSATIGGLTSGTSYTFTVRAVNAQGAGPVSAASNAVVPTAAPGFAPFASWSALVDRQFRDVVNRAPSAAETSSWTTQLANGSRTRGQLVEALRTSNENVTNVDPATRLYRAFFLRIPDRGGLEFWIARRRSGAWSLVRTADSFATSSEFQNRYGRLSNRDFIRLIYDNVLERPYDQGGLDFWTRQLDERRRTRGSVMVGFSESSEYVRTQRENVDVAVAHIFLLRRSPTPAEADSWAARHRAGTSQAVLLGELLASAAYAARIGG